jgi:hypothetical protein
VADYNPPRDVPLYLPLGGVLFTEQVQVDALISMGLAHRGVHGEAIFTNFRSVEVDRRECGGRVRITYYTADSQFNSLDDVGWMSAMLPVLTEQEVCQIIQRLAPQQAQCSLGQAVTCWRRGYAAKTSRTCPPGEHYPCLQVFLAIDALMP